MDALSSMMLSSFSAAVVPHAPLAELLPSDGILRHDPAASPLGFTLLSQLRLWHPVVTGECLAPRALGWRADLASPVCMAGQRLVAGEHAKAPERQASRQGGLFVVSTGLTLVGQLRAADL